MKPEKIELNISAERFSKLLNDIELGVEFGYPDKVQGALDALYKAASKEDQKAISNATDGKYDWLRKVYMEASEGRPA